jgi:hypothetical protein
MVCTYTGLKAVADAAVRFPQTPPHPSPRLSVTRQGQIRPFSCSSTLIGIDQSLRSCSGPSMILA